jgi:transketolase
MSDYSLEKHKAAATTIRGLAMDAVQKAGNGHPGMPMGMADVAVVLWTQFLKHNPDDPHWPNRDRFVLSAGHGSMLLYSLLHLSGYALPMEEIQNLRQWGSLTPGHPEHGLTPGVETTTGPLGQGISNAVGMALAERWLAERFNRPNFPLVDHYTYTIASDGDLMEGISHEVSSLAGHLGLGKLIVLYDDNHISIDGSTDLAFTEDVRQRYEAYSWHTASIDGHDPEAVLKALHAAQAEKERPSLIACRTHIGFGSPNKQDTAKAHGEALGEEEVRLAKERLGLPVDEYFTVLDGVRPFMEASGEAGRGKQMSWQAMWGHYCEEYPELAESWNYGQANALRDGWDSELPVFDPGSKPLATRAASGQVLNAIAAAVPALLGGSGDLTGSNNTLIKGTDSLTPDSFAGRYIHFGVREHGMGGILNGMALHGGIRPYGGTFLVFSDYMRPTIRLAALMELPVIYIFTHDSIGLGEDGPTHQPIEHVMSLRMIPNLTTFRPADANETAVGWRVALENLRGPTALILTRQALPILPFPTAGATRGAYILSPGDKPEQPDVILIGTGSEVQLAVKAQELLAADGIAARVVSMPSWELFEAQPADYRESVLPPTVIARVSIEAGTPIGWERYVGLRGAAVGLNRFGASAPYKTIYEKLGITAEAMAEAARDLLA